MEIAFRFSEMANGPKIRSSMIASVQEVRTRFGQIYELTLMSLVVYNVVILLKCGVMSRKSFCWPQTMHQIPDVLL